MATQRRARTNKRQGKGSGRTTASRRNAQATGRSETVEPVTSTAGAGSVVVSPRRGERGTSTASGNSARSGQKERAGSSASKLSERFDGLQKVIADTRSELRRVNWPDKETTQNLTLVVIAISVVLGILLGGIDYVLFQLFEALT
ncbi:MAG TPA: preprotein translocase subunit SecE [Thermomicrobiales bacterium]|nr:preprotein translocase subunit SecE [Thermomicrobiales bacterium]